MTPEEKELGLERIRQWPRAAIDDAARLPGAEQRLLVEAAALLDIRPGAPEGRPQDIIEISA